MNDPAPAISVAQSSMLGLCPIVEAVRALSDAGIEERGAIFTRREVVDFILDLAGYTVDRPLHEMRLLEPSFGNGDFLIPAIERLMLAWRRAGCPEPIAALAESIRGVELHRLTFVNTRERIGHFLIQEGLSHEVAHLLADKWLLYADYLLIDIGDSFDFIVGNPPYVRQELIPDVLMAEYRRRYKTIYDRADIYIPFIERSLSLLSSVGSLVFICADRWMKNRYGAPLRGLVAAKFHLSAYIDMVGTQPFHSEVVAYPAITVITSQTEAPTRIARSPKIERKSLQRLAKEIRSDTLSPSGDLVKELSDVACGSAPWILDTSTELALVRKLETAFPTLEEAGCKVGIGVATGADQAFIGLYDELDVEEDRKLPLVMTRDILDGTVAWRGFGVINPFSDSGALVNLDDYPRLRRYLEGHKKIIANRHVAKRIPANWFRTIDRIYPETAKKKSFLFRISKGRRTSSTKRAIFTHTTIYILSRQRHGTCALFKQSLCLV